MIIGYSVEWKFPGETETLRGNLTQYKTPQISHVTWPGNELEAPGLLSQRLPVLRQNPDSNGFSLPRLEFEVRTVNVEYVTIKWYWSKVFYENFSIRQEISIHQSPPFRCVIQSSSHFTITNSVLRIHPHFYNRPWKPIGLWDVEAPTFYRQWTYRWQWGCQPYAPGAFYPQEVSWYSFLLEAESTQGP
jgi:hypothetical protein